MKPDQIQVRGCPAEFRHPSHMQFHLRQFSDPTAPPIDEPPAGPDNPNVPVKDPDPIQTPEVPVREPDPAEPNQI